MGYSHNIEVLENVTGEIIDINTAVLLNASLVPHRAHDRQVSIWPSVYLRIVHELIVYLESNPHCLGKS